MNLKFEFEGTKYRIDFTREARTVKQFRGYADSVDTSNGEVIKVPVVVDVPARYPYTTVTLWKTMPGGGEVIYRSYTVGCIHTDSYTLEDGRLAALRMLSKSNSLDKPFKKAMWTCYFDRFNQKHNPAKTVNGETIH